MEAIAAFLAEHERRNHSPATIAAYRDTLTKFARVVPDLLGADRAEIRTAVSVAFTGAAASRNRHLAAIKSFYRWAVDERLRADDPVYTLPTSSLPLRRPKLVDDHTAAALAGDTCVTPMDFRDAAMIAFLTTTAVRVSELVALDVMSISTDVVTVIGKGNKERIVFLDAATEKLVRSWLDRRSQFNPQTGALFISVTGTRLTTERVRQVLAKRAGGVKVTPHMLRHTLATRYVERGVNLEAIRKLLGHSSLTTTQHYLHMSARHLRNELNRTGQ